MAMIVVYPEEYKGCQRLPFYKLLNTIYIFSRQLPSVSLMHACMDVYKLMVILEAPRVQSLIS